MKTVPKAQFKPKAFAYFRMVEETGEDLIITDHGKAVLRISRTVDENDRVLKELIDSVVEYLDLCEPVAREDWDLL